MESATPLPQSFIDLKKIIFDQIIAGRIRESAPVENLQYQHHVFRILGLNIAKVAEIMPLFTTSRQL